MIERFQGDAGKHALLSVLVRNTVVANNRDLAEKLVATGELIPVKVGESIITQGSPDNDVFFVIAGSFELIVNNTVINVRNPGDHVGEMSAFAPHIPRSATLMAKSSSLVLKVPAAVFIEALMQNKEALLGVVSTLVERLNSRNALVRQKNTFPKVFIISSVEGLEIARGIEQGLSHERFEVTVWTERTFEPSGYPLPSLQEKISSSDFCIVVASPDDNLKRRKVDYVVPRDNVIFEAGMGVGALGIPRTLIVVPRQNAPQLPTDLTGLTTIGYAESTSGPLLGPVCTEIRNAIQRIGVR